jgi:hypothetical protein
VAGAPSSALYVTGEDHLRVTSFGSLGAVELAIEGRFLSLTGEVRPFLERHVPLNSRAAATTTHFLAEGFLTHLSVRASTGAPLNGQVFVLVELCRGQTGPLQLLGCLLQGYVTSVQRLAWPGSALQSSVVGPGAFRIVGGTNPAAGVEISETTPVGARWRLIGLRASLVTSAVVGNRRVVLDFDDGINAHVSVGSAVDQPASTTRIYTFTAAGSDAATVTGTDIRIAIPHVPLLAGHRVRTRTSGLDAGDDWGQPIYSVEEWIEG